MRINTAQSIATGSEIHARFGSWKAARDAARFKDGRYVVSRAAAPKPAKK